MATWSNKDFIERMKNEGEVVKIDWEQRRKHAEERYGEAIAKYNKEKEEEEARIKNMQCPVCKSVEKDHVLKSEDNGVCGPGYHSYVTDDYYVCKGCGVHYSDLSKKKIDYPDRDKFFW